MDIATTTLVLVGIAVMGGYIGLSRLSEKVDELKEDVREFARIEAKDADARELSLSRNLGRIEGYSSASFEGVSDIRNTLENS